jgi:hypothetical protein
VESISSIQPPELCPFIFVSEDAALAVIEADPYCFAAGGN